MLLPTLHIVDRDVFDNDGEDEEKHDGDGMRPVEMDKVGTVHWYRRSLFSGSDGKHIGDTHLTLRL